MKVFFQNGLVQDLKNTKNSMVTLIDPAKKIGRSIIMVLVNTKTIKKVFDSIDSPQMIK